GLKVLREFFTIASEPQGVTRQTKVNLSPPKNHSSRWRSRQRARADRRKVQSFGRRVRGRRLPRGPERRRPVIRATIRDRLRADAVHRLETAHENGKYSGSRPGANQARRDAGTEPESGGGISQTASSVRQLCNRTQDRYLENAANAPISVQKSWPSLDDLNKIGSFP